MKNPLRGLGERVAQLGFVSSLLERLPPAARGVLVDLLKRGKFSGELLRRGPLPPGAVNNVSLLVAAIERGMTAGTINVVRGPVQDGTVEAANLVLGDVSGGLLRAVNMVVGDVKGGELDAINVVVGAVEGGTLRHVNALVGDVRGGTIRGTHILIGDVYDGDVEVDVHLGRVHGGRMKSEHSLGDG